MAELMPINVVPHFMRLHEWVAVAEGHFEAEGLEARMLEDVMHRVSSHGSDPYFERPQDAPFVRAEEVANSACEWGSICNAGAGMGKFVPDLYGVARFGFFVRSGSPIRRLSELRGVPVGVGLMAGSHFTALRTLETVLPRSEIKVENVGGPGRRLLALLRGEVEVANLLDPEIAIAEAEGMKCIAQGEFRTLFWVSPTISPSLLAAYFRAMRRADDSLRATPQRYMELWERNVPPDLKKRYDYSRFGLGELLVFERYPDEVYAESVAFARRWGLDEHMRDAGYERLALTVTV
jgi:hypothetical protein